MLSEEHLVSLGKTMCTWGYGANADHWEASLTDSDGPYAELMASSYSLNQPDFSWLMPYEGREFSQMWYPVGGIGLPLCACREAVLSAEGGRLGPRSRTATPRPIPPPTGGRPCAATRSTCPR